MVGNSTYLTEAQEIYETSGLPHGEIQALLGYARAVDWNASYFLEHEADEPDKAASCLRMALSQIAVLCGATPGTAI